MTRPALAIDTWGFFEVALDKPRGAEVGGLMDEVERAFTTRDVVVETFSGLLHRTRSGAVAWAWMEDLRRSRVKIFEPAFEEVRAWAATKERGNLSLVDLGLAYVASRERTKSILTEDAEFRKVGLDPLFAR